MKKVKSIVAMLLLATSFAGYAQDNRPMPPESANPGLIAVVNRANWCAICKANGQRFAGVLMPYAAKGVNIYFNDLTNEATKAASKTELQRAGVYEAVTTIPAKGVGKMLKACGLKKDRKLSTEVSGIVIFINPKTHRQIRQLSITVADETMRNTIDKLLK